MVAAKKKKKPLGSKFKKNKSSRSSTPQKTASKKPSKSLKVKPKGKSKTVVIAKPKSPKILRGSSKTDKTQKKGQGKPRMVKTKPGASKKGGLKAKPLTPPKAALKSALVAPTGKHSKGESSKKDSQGEGLKALYATGATKAATGPNEEFEKVFEDEIESFDESKHTGFAKGSEAPAEEEDDNYLPEPPQDEGLFDYDDDDLEY
jgi:hypothetical protein